VGQLDEQSRAKKSDDRLARATMYFDAAREVRNHPEEKGFEVDYPSSNGITRENGPVWRKLFRQV
jgi:hypothetical protein